MLSDFLKELLDELPKIALTAILIPVFRWLLNRLWQARRRSRRNTIRKRISELTDFLSKETSTNEDQNVKDVFTYAATERTKLFQDLKTAHTPLTVSYPVLQTISRVLLLSSRRYPISYVIRVAYYVISAFALIGVCLTYLDFKFFNVVILLTFSLFSFGLYQAARYVESLTIGPPTRPMWRRVLLVYTPSDALAQMFRFLCFVNISFFLTQVIGERFLLVHPHSIDSVPKRFRAFIEFFFNLFPDTPQLVEVGVLYSFVLAILWFFIDAFDRGVEPYPKLLESLLLNAIHKRIWTKSKPDAQ